MVALCSKTYVLEDKDGFYKTALKGLNKGYIVNPLEKCKEVLVTCKTDVGVNKGFRVRDNTLFTYEQLRAGIENFYCKRELVDDIHTKPLDIVLCPGKNSNAQKLRMIFYLLFTLLVLVWELKIFKIFMRTVKL